MTKKIDEAVSLNVSSSQGEMTSNTTFTAEDTAALAVMLKNAGIAGNSTMFNGPATMTVDAVEGTSSMSTIIQAPDLRSIMQLLEPEFAATADLDAAIDDFNDAEATAQVQADAALDSDEIAPEAPVDALDDMPMGTDVYADVDMEEAVIDASGAFKQRQADTKAMRTNNTLADISAGVDDYLNDILGKPEKYSDENGVVVDAGDEFRARRKEIDNERSYAYNQAKLTGVADPSERYYDDEDEDEESTDGAYRDAENEYDDEIEEDADYDYRSHDVEPKPYAGVADRKPVQPKTKSIPARSGDNPLEEDVSFPDTEEGAIEALRAWSNFGDRLNDATAKPDPVSDGVWLVSYQGGRSIVYLNQQDFESVDESLSEDVGETFSFRTYFELGGQEVEANVKYTTYGDRTELESVVNDMTGDEILPQLPREMVEKLTAHAVDDFKSNSKGVAAQSRGFADYFNEAKARNHVAPKKSVGSDDLLDEFRLNELSGELKDRYAAAAHASKAHHEKKAGAADDRLYDRWASKRHGVESNPDAEARLTRYMKKHDSIARKREKGLDHLGQLDEISDETKNSYFKKAAADIDTHANHSSKMRGIGNDDQADKHDAKILKRAQGMNRAIAREEEELDEAGYNQREQKTRQYGEPFYLNTDCGYASLESIMNGTAEYFDDMQSGSSKIGVTVLEINRNGKTGLNYITGLDRTPAGTKVTCVTATSTGEKYRPGKVITSFTSNDLVNNYDMVVDQLASHGISPSKKLPVKTFD